MASEKMKQLAQVLTMALDAAPSGSESELEIIGEFLSSLVRKCLKIVEAPISPSTAMGIPRGKLVPEIAAAILAEFGMERESGHPQKSPHAY